LCSRLAAKGCLGKGDLMIIYSLKAKNRGARGEVVLLLKENFSVSKTRKQQTRLNKTEKGFQSLAANISLKLVPTKYFLTLISNTFFAISNTSTLKKGAPSGKGCVRSSKIPIVI
jgi:hypothetical protein